MAKQSTWQNADGLGQGYGRHTADVNTASQFSGANGTEVLEVRVDDVTKLQTAGGVALGNDELYVPGFYRNAAKIPAGATIQSVYVKADVGLVATSGTPEIQVGTYLQDANGNYVVTGGGDADSLINPADHVIGNLASDGDSMQFQRGVYNSYGTINSVSTAALLVKGSGSTTAEFYVIPTRSTSDTFSAGAITVRVEYHTA